MKLIHKILCFILSTSWASSSIAGISYLDPLIKKPLKPLPGENPCNPLYWYPRQIPGYCYNKVEIQPVKPKPAPVMPMPTSSPMAPMPPMAIPVPYPIPMYPMPIFPSAIPQFVPPPVSQILPPPVPQMPVPYGVPSFNPMLPMPAPIPAPYPFQPQAGLVPGIPGMVSQDGGINILPFSDAYSDMLEKHKQKMIRKRLQKILDDYKDYPRKRRYRKNNGRDY